MARFQPSPLTASEPYRLADIVVGPDSSYARWLGTEESLAYFYVPEHGSSDKSQGLWVTNGTREGTKPVPLKDKEGLEVMLSEWLGLGPKAPGDYALSGRLLYLGDEKGLWVTDGSQDGPRHLTSSVPSLLFERSGKLRDGRLVFSVDLSGLWITDGTSEGTKLLSHDIGGIAWRGGTASTPNGLFFYGAGDFGVEISVSDGTPEGTRQVKDIFPGSGGSLPEGLGEPPLSLMAAVGDRCFFIADDGVHGIELWVSDVTADGTRLVRDIWPGPDGSIPGKLTAAGARVFFAANDPTGERSLWVSDGTEAGTRAVGNVPASELAVFAGDHVCYLDYASELNVSDGTVEGTRVLLQDVGWALDGSAGVGAAGNIAYAWSLGSGGGSVYATDGTEFGTHLVCSFTGPRINHIEPIVVATMYYWVPLFWPEKRLVLFRGDDGETGHEPWVLPLDSIPAETRFHRGDPNSSGTTDISDSLSIFGYLFLGADAPRCLESADVNNDGTIDISDGIAILNYLFLGGSDPAPPGPASAACGFDTDTPGSQGDLGCGSYSGC